MNAKKKMGSQLKIIKQLKNDIWGKYEKKKLRIYRKINERYIDENSEEQTPPMSKTHAIKHMFAFIKYHGNIKKKKLRDVIIKTTPAMAQLYRNTHGPYLYECHLTMIVYRMNLVNTIFQANELISSGGVQVNGVCITDRNYFMNPGDKISLKNEIRLSFLKNVRLLLRKEKAIVETPLYMIYSLKTLSALLWRFPLYEEAPYSYPFGSITAPGIIFHQS